MKLLVKLCNQFVDFLDSYIYLGNNVYKNNLLK